MSLESPVSVCSHFVVLFFLLVALDCLQVSLVALLSLVFLSPGFPVFYYQLCNLCILVPRNLLSFNENLGYLTTIAITLLLLNVTYEFNL